jgi:hypothetical protein
LRTGLLSAAVASFVASAAAVQMDHSSNSLGKVVRINLDTTGTQATSLADNPVVTPNGRFVTFLSIAPLVANDTNTVCDGYLLDFANGHPPELISVGLSGFAGNLQSNGECNVSADGRFVAFTSAASDLVANDTNGNWDAFVRDRTLGVTFLCSLSNTGSQGHALSYCDVSDDGRFVAFSSWLALAPIDINGLPDVFVRDRLASTTERVSLNSTGGDGNGGSGELDRIEITPDGRYVGFTSSASNLVAGDTNARGDVFVRDRVSGITHVASVDANGQVGDGDSWDCRISNDGRYVAFISTSTNLVPGDTNGAWDAFLRDFASGATERLSVDSFGSQANGRSGALSMTPDARHASFGSWASNLVPGDSNGTWDVFRRDRWTSHTVRLSVTTSSAQANGPSILNSISGDGRVVAFSSDAINLVSGDTNGVTDVFVRRAGFPQVYCTAKTNSLGCASAVQMSGLALASTSEGGFVRASNVLNQKRGALLYSISGAAAVPFQGGTLCLAGPTRRTPVQNSGGSLSGLDCSGRFDFGFNAWIANGNDPSLAAGRQVWAQYWSRDPGFPPPGNANLTDALTFEISP